MGKPIRNRAFAGTRMLLGIFAIVALATPVFAAAFGNAFGGNARGLNATDVDLLEKAVSQVLDAQTQGAVAPWENRETRQSGRAAVRRVYERDGMKCAEVEHVFTSGDSNRYVVPFCRVASGEWKIAF